MKLAKVTNNVHLRTLKKPHHMKHSSMIRNLIIHIIFIHLTQNTYRTNEQLLNHQNWSFIGKVCVHFQEM